MQNGKIRRQMRVRKKLRAVSLLPRLSVHRTNKYIYAQIIDDTTGKTLVSAIEEKEMKKGNKTERAKIVGSSIAKKAIEKKVKKVVFDKGRFMYHGRVKALAEGAREGGLEF